MKINLGGKKLKKSFFPISFDSSTSCNFGECVPTFMQEVVADSHVNIDMRSAVRFAPLTLPTFGRAYLHSYAFYHKFADLWKPYNDFIAQTPYSNGSGSTYVPSQSPCLPLSFLWWIVVNHCSWSLWAIRSYNVPSTNGSPVDAVQYSIVPFDLSQPYLYEFGLPATLAHVVNLGSADSPSLPLFSYLSNEARKSNLVVGLDSHVPNTFVSGDDAIYPAGSDYFVKINASNLFYSSDGVFHGSGGNTDLLLTIKLNNSGKLLRKIFMGLGYQIANVGPSAKPVSMLPLFAYYRSYFDTFAPKRFVKYDQTFFGRVMSVVENTGLSLQDVLFTDNGFTEGSPLSGFIDDLLACFYTEDTDYYSSQILGLVNDYGADLKQPYMAVGSDGQVRGSQLSSDVSKGAEPSIDFSSDSVAHTQSQQNILARLTNFVNRRSFVGGKIADLLESVFGIPKKDVFDDDNPYIGSNVVDVDFSDVFSTAETSEASLGEYAGKALGIGSSDYLSVDCSSPGVVLVFSTVIPRTQKVQGVNPNLFHVRPSDYYNPQFDGLTLLPTSIYSLYCIDGPSARGAGPDRSFGNQSVFAEYKTKTQGILNGDLSLLSTKSSYDSFTLDQVFANYIVQDPIDETTKGVSFVYVGPWEGNIVAGTMWRYVGRWLWLGNFDRIFVNQRQNFALSQKNPLGSSFLDVTWTSRDTHVTDDNLVVHNVVDLKINAPMLPLEDSYMTRDLEDLNNDAGVRSQGE